MISVPNLEFPTLVDSTMRGSWIVCNTQAMYGHFMHIASRSPSIHLHAGGAFASALEATRRAYYERNLPIDESLRQGLAELLRFYGPIQLTPARTGDKSCDNMVKAFDSYFQRYPLDKDLLKPYMTADGKAMVEFRFSMPLGVPHPVTGDPILYGGRADMIAIYNDTLLVVDEKTGTQLGESWASQWELDSQFTGYIKAAQVHGFPVSGACIRGIGLLKTKITHAEQFVYRSPWEIDRWWDELHDDVENMVRAWKRGAYKQALHKSACAAYGGCAYKMLCRSQNPEGWIPMHYREHKWDPLAKDLGEKLLENTEFMEQSQAPELSIADLT